MAQAVGKSAPHPARAPQGAKEITTEIGTAMPFFLSAMVFRPSGVYIDLEFASHLVTLDCLTEYAGVDAAEQESRCRLTIDRVPVS
jgi:hypothetical protein